MKSIPSSSTPEPVYYWHIYRRTRRGRGSYNGWKFHCDFTGTKASVAEFWRKHFHGGEYRLKRLLKY